ncbi:transcription factor TFIIIC subunit TFC6 Ecym_5522 [Eremothecium cymbalariae DBVPG|uniref:Uncharacterized protein n=1 Tax=Eremothecium cymbalariae (strain CBS 270.75 / DBVPG 7215 / KCTC 17166 / NRRL Y-17582) TaxID=931890 RepID=I6NDX1_ERECY|nr:hypothetical protein Ecym_5522 [Eremothecium cymbalariae DBVPG\
MPPRKVRSRPKKCVESAQTSSQDSISGFALFNKVTSDATAAAAAAAVVNDLPKSNPTESLRKRPHRMASLKAETSLRDDLMDIDVVAKNGFKHSTNGDKNEDDDNDDTDFVPEQGLIEENIVSTGVGITGEYSEVGGLGLLADMGNNDLLALPSRFVVNEGTDGADHRRANNKRKAGTRVIRAMKDLSSARDKLERIYGTNRQKLLGLAKLKEGFETHVFDFPEEYLRSSSRYFVETMNILETAKFSELNPKPQESEILTQLELDQLFPVSNELPKNILISGANFSLYRDQKSEFPILPCGKRTGFVYNVGGLITDMAWLRSDDSVYQYLAVAVSNVDTANDMRLRMTGINKHFSIIEIYRLNTDSLEFVKIQTVVHEFGEIWDLKWHDAFSQTAKGLLGFVCQLGSIKFVEITFTEDYEIRLITEVCLEVQMQSSQITCFDFRSSSTVICGFYNGYVGEFVIGSAIPNFYKKIHETYVLSVVSAYSPYEENAIFSTSVDGTSYLYSPKDIQTTKCALPRNRGTNISPVVYVPQLYSIVHTDGVSCLKAFTPRAVFGTHQICQHKNNIGCIGSSRLHPYVLSGSADGSIILNNLVRRILQGIKGNTDVYKFIRLWKWDYSVTSNIYRLDPNFEVSNFAMNEVSNTRIDPTPINIQSIKWNESMNTGKFYAFANAAGLLVVERLGEDRSTHL